MTTLTVSNTWRSAPPAMVITTTHCDLDLESWSLDDMMQVLQSGDDSSELAPQEEPPAKPVVEPQPAAPRRKRRKAEPVDVVEERSRRNEHEKRRIKEMSELSKLLAAEIREHNPQLKCDTRVAVLESALDLLKKQRGKLSALKQEGSAQSAPMLCKALMPSNQSALGIPAGMSHQMACAQGEVDYGFAFLHGSRAQANMGLSGNFLSVNHAFRTMCSIFQDPNRLNITMADMTPPDEMPMMMQSFGQLMVGQQSSVTIRKTCICPGKVICVEAEITINRDEFNQPISFTCDVLPVTPPSSFTTDLQDSLSMNGST
eukprot:TRINITY_DN14774_c0_g1_i2.p1 TRINITY_DN14774_c0_g1~~TRINITY_DN14774_c0_g1_i2.p1  ORF type:complete len:316 (-),score=51.10 TRINITY_DN14774_c0_g1_i2:400-1347(-)